MKRAILIAGALAALAMAIAAQTPYPPVPPGACATHMYCDYMGCRPIVVCN